MTYAAPSTTILDGVTRIAADAEPGQDWTPPVVASFTTLVERPATPVRDHHGREHDVLIPAAAQLSRWLLPPGPEFPVPALPTGPARSAGVNTAQQQRFFAGRPW